MPAQPPACSLLTARADLHGVAEEQEERRGRDQARAVLHLRGVCRPDDAASTAAGKSGIPY